MTREVVSSVKPAVRAQAKTEKVRRRVCGCASWSVYGAAVLTFAVLLFRIGYILRTAFRILPSLFRELYSLENASMMPANSLRLKTTALALLLAVPLGLFTAVYLNEYAAANKLVNVIRITTEIPAPVHRIRPARHAVLRHQAALGILLLAGAMTLAIMILPLIMRTLEEALIAVPDSYQRLCSVRRRTPAHGIPHRAACCGSRHPVRCYPRYRTHRR